MTGTPHRPSPAGAVLTRRRCWHWSAALKAARLPPLMALLAFVLAGTAAGAYRMGAIMVTAYTLAGVAWGEPIAGPWRSSRRPAGERIAESADLMCRQRRSREN